MASIENIKASDGSGNASVATVQSSRSPGASTIIVDTVLGINGAGFMGTMGTPHTFTDPITSEVITVISEATAVDFSGHVDGTNLEIDDIADGYTDDGSEVGDIVIIRPTTQWGDNVAEVLEVAHNDDGTLKDDAVTTDVIDDDAVTAPKVSGIDKSNLTVDSNPYKFSVYRNGAQNLAASSATKVQFETEEFDTNNNYDPTTNHRYTAPVDGYYSLSAVISVAAPGTGNNYYASIYKNGAELKRGAQQTSASSSIAVGVSHPCIKLLAGDYVEIFGGSTYGSTTPLNVSNVFTTWFAGALLSRA